jgi:PAS domain S-box-containing protein
MRLPLVDHGVKVGVEVSGPGPGGGSDGESIGFWTLAESLPQLVWIADATGTVTYYNQRFRHYAGIESAEDGTWVWAPAVHPDDAQRTAAAWELAVAEMSPYECEHRVRMADGNYRWHVSRALVVPASEGREPVWFGTATDVDAQKRVEEVLRESERRFRDTFENAAVGVAHIGVNGRFLEVNETLCRITGYGRDRLVSLRFQDITHANDVEHAARNAADLFSGVVDVVTGDMQWLRDDGTHVWVHVTASASGTDSPDDRHLIAVIEDIAERKRAERAVREAVRALDESEKRFRSMTNDLPLLVWVHDAAGVQEFVNDTFCTYFGVPRDDLASGNWRMLVHPDDLDEYVAEFAGCVREQRAFHAEVRVQRGDGRWRLLESWASPRFGDDKEFRGHVGVSLDITERRAAEDELVERHHEEQRARRRAEFVAELITELETTQSVAARAQRLADMVVERFAEIVVVDLRSLDPPVLAIASREPARGDELRALLQEDPSRSPLDGSEAITSAELRVGRRMIGTLHVGFGGAPLDRSAALRTMLHDVADRSALVLRSAQLREEEHQAAIRLQRALLPHKNLEHPALQIATLYVAAADALEVGGDWFESFELPDGRIAVVVGDVVGHNIEAAVAMGQLRSGMLALAEQICEPAELLSALDSFSHRHSVTGYATACCAVLDPATGELRYASAGHPPMLVWTPGGQARWLDDVQSPPLGVRPGAPRPQGSTRLEPGSVLVGYSDGLVERRFQSIDVGMLQLLGLADGFGDADAGEICDDIIAGMIGDDTHGDETHDDDTVLLCLRLIDPDPEST